MSSVVSFFGGMASQAGKNAMLEPWWGDNRASSDAVTRWGQRTADAGFVLGGGAIATLGTLKFLQLQRAIPSGGLVKGVHEAVTHGPSLLKIGAIAAVGLGVSGALTGVKNLFFGRQAPARPPTVPPADPPADPPDDPPSIPPGKPPTDPPTPPAPPTKPVPPGEPPAPPALPAPPTDPGQQPVVHSVKQGEYLSFIASCYDISWRQLYWYNRDTIGPNPDIIKVGMRLEIPPRDYKPDSFDYRPSYPPGQPSPRLTCPPGTHGADDCS